MTISNVKCHCGNNRGKSGLCWVCDPVEVFMNVKPNQHSRQTRRMVSGLNFKPKNGMGHHRGKIESENNKIK
jgi:hypothetical protein